jgi:hypothetical protein
VLVLGRYPSLARSHLVERPFVSFWIGQNLAMVKRTRLRTSRLKVRLRGRTRAEVNEVAVSKYHNAARIMTRLRRLPTKSLMKWYESRVFNTSLRLSTKRQGIPDKLDLISRTELILCPSLSVLMVFSTNEQIRTQASGQSP